MHIPPRSLRAAAGGHALLTRLDLTDELVIRDATAELHRCKTDADFAAWSRKWGDAAMKTLSDASAYGCGAVQ